MSERMRENEINWKELFTEERSARMHSQLHATKNARRLFLIGACVGALAQQGCGYNANHERLQNEYTYFLERPGAIIDSVHHRINGVRTNESVTMGASVTEGIQRRIVEDMDALNPNYVTKWQYTGNVR